MAKVLINNGFRHPNTSHIVPSELHGVQGVASSNPAVPTNEINGLALTRC